jgi:macrolide transport system ATP-binding/permease protein
MTRRRRMLEDLDQQIRDHIEQETQDNIARGWSPEEARHAALRKFGNVTPAKEDARAVWIWPWCESVWQDVAYALRSLRRQPAFAIVPLAALATTIGVSVSAFTVFNALMLKPWPVKDPNRVVSLFAKDAEGATGFSLAEYQYFADHATSFAGLVVRHSALATLGDEAVGQATRGVAVSGNFFDVLGLTMARGRGFLPDDDRPDAPQAVAVLNHRLWQTRFGGDADIVGKTMRFNDVPFVVVGVASRDFIGLEPGKEDFWIPLSALPVLQPNVWSTGRLHAPNFCCWEVAGRLAPGVNRLLAQDEIARLSRQFRSSFALAPQDIGLSGTSFFERPNSKRQIVPIFALMLLAVTLVLIIACANVGNLLLARTLARAHEIGVRLSLGASRGRLIRQLLTESLVLALGAGAIGTALAYWLPNLILNLFGQAPPLPIVPDATVLGFALLLTAVVCLGAGLAPALHATRGDLATALKEQPAQSSVRFSLRGVLLTVQIAVSVCLLAAAALLFRSLQQAEAQDLGFAIKATSVVSFELPAAVPPAMFIAQLAAELKDAHAEAFGVASQEPLSHGQTAPVRLPGQRDGQQRQIAMDDVSAGYFDVLRIPVVAGRNFNAMDATRSMAVVNESMATRYWPNENPIGQTFFIGSESREIVGVVRDAHTAGVTKIEPMFYRPWHPDPTGPRAVLLIRTNSSMQNTIAVLARHIAAHVRVQITPLADSFKRALAPSRAGAMVAGSLGVFALILATVGMSGVFGYMVQQRTREIGIRMALGATPSQIVRLVLAGHSRPLLAGLVVGLMGATSGSLLLQRYLYGIGPLDPVAFAQVCAVLACAALAATYGPARLASHVDPAITLRAQ